MDETTLLWGALSNKQVVQKIGTNTTQYNISQKNKNANGALLTFGNNKQFVEILEGRTFSYLETGKVKNNDLPKNRNHKNNKNTANYKNNMYSNDFLGNFLNMIS